MVSISSSFAYRLAAITQSIPKLHNTFNITIMILIHILYTMPLCVLKVYEMSYDYPAVLEDTKEV